MTIVYLENDPNGICCGDPGEGAALGLLGLMLGISEECWCAGWMSDLEFALWEAPAGKRYGQGEISERQSTLLRLLSEECDGWWYHDKVGGLKFIRVGKWRERLTVFRGEH